MRVANVPLVARNLLLVVFNRAAKLGRMSRRFTRQRVKQVSESAKHVRAQVRGGGAWGRDTTRQLYASSVRTTRAWDRASRRAWNTMAVEASVRRELAAAARGDAPVVVGPWLGEVGYEALYWAPFVRWFANYYRVPRERLVVVSRGGVASWYRDVASEYVELLDLFTPQAFASKNQERYGAGDQKQMRVGAFDEEILALVRGRIGAARTHLVHPSSMFRLMRHFWLGTEALQLVLDHTRHTMLTTPHGEDLAGLPEHFVAVKFYSGRSLPDSKSTRDALRVLLRQAAGDRPIVTLNTSLSLDEHADYVLEGLPRVITLDPWLTPQNNLGVQTEIIRRASLFVGTCGSLAWLAPMLGTDTLAVYADDHLLTPHLYAASQIYQAIGAAPFTPLNVRALDALGIAASST